MYKHNGYLDRFCFNTFIFSIDLTHFFRQIYFGGPQKSYVVLRKEGRLKGMSMLSVSFSTKSLGDVDLLVSVTWSQKVPKFLFSLKHFNRLGHFSHYMCLYMYLLIWYLVMIYRYCVPCYWWWYVSIPTRH